MKWNVHLCKCIKLTFPKLTEASVNDISFTMPIPFSNSVLSVCLQSAANTVSSNAIPV